MKSTMITLGLIAALGMPAAAHATSHDSAKADVQDQTALVDGEVRKVDRAAKKITIRHGALANLDMPPMTMVFQVKDPAMLDQVKAGDKVRFLADKVSGAYTLIQLETVK
jgi:Cu/Ag efflux protein CusF